MIDENKFISLDFFNTLLRLSPIKKDSNLEFIFKVYRNSIHNILIILDNRKQNEEMFLNPLAIFKYVTSEYDYMISKMSDEEKNNILNNQPLFIALCNTVVDKYLTLEHFYFRMERVNNKYYPPLSSIDLYTNYILHKLKGLKRQSLPETLMNDMFYKFFSMVHCVVDLLSNGYETEALSTWRTIHETECNIIILHNHPETVQSYLRHITYNLAFRNTIENKEEQDKIFLELKQKMRDHGLKSKDMKRFIEVGWIYAINDIENDPNVKLNFRNGIEYVAGLEKENMWYEMSSEIAHSSPLLIYSNNILFFDLTLVALFKSFLNIEQIFHTLYLPLIKDNKELQNYLSTRDLRLPEIKRIYDIESKKFEDEQEDEENNKENEKDVE
ncbi:MAG: DUF5677 domain-containing protein [Bacilli bacterium]